MWNIFKEEQLFQYKSYPNIFKRDLILIILSIKNIMCDRILISIFILVYITFFILQVDLLYFLVAMQSPSYFSFFLR
jgi:hypothetical protein